MSLYDEVKQGSYKDAINQIAKKIDGLGENSGQKIELCHAYYSVSNYNGADGFELSEDEYSPIIFYTTTDYDLIIPLYITCMYGSEIRAYVYGHIVDNNSKNGVLYVTGIIHNHGTYSGSVDPVLWYIGVKEGE